MSIYIDINSARAVNNQLPAFIKHIAEMNTIISTVTSSLDSEIIKRRDLQKRLKDTQYNIEAIELDLLLLHRTIEQNLNSYEDNEKRLIASVQNLRIQPNS